MQNGYGGIDTLTVFPALYRSFFLFSEQTPVLLDAELGFCYEWQVVDLRHRRSTTENPVSVHRGVQHALPPFIPLPRFMLAGEYSINAKLLYGLLLNRTTLAPKSGWVPTLKKAKAARASRDGLSSSGCWMTFRAEKCIRTMCWFSNYRDLAETRGMC